MFLSWFSGSTDATVSSETPTERNTESSGIQHDKQPSMMLVSEDAYIEKTQQLENTVQQLQEIVERFGDKQTQFEDKQKYLEDKILQLENTLRAQNITMQELRKKNAAPVLPSQLPPPVFPHFTPSTHQSFSPINYAPNPFNPAPSTPYRNYP